MCADVEHRHRCRIDRVAQVHTTSVALIVELLYSVLMAEGVTIAFIVRTTNKELVWGVLLQERSQWRASSGTVPCTVKHGH